jgi:CHASE1-domain containing sensor protein
MKIIEVFVGGILSLFKTDIESESWIPFLSMLVGLLSTVAIVIVRFMREKTKRIEIQSVLEATKDTNLTNQKIARDKNRTALEIAKLNREKDDQSPRMRVLPKK